MARQCSAITAGGSRCRRLAADGNEYCSAHDPAKAEVRRRAASKGGRARSGTSEIRQLKDEIRETLERIATGELERGVGAVVLQGYNTLARYLELERKVREVEELEERLETLEALQDNGLELHRWER